MMTSTTHCSAAPDGGESLVARDPRVNIHAFCDNQQTAQVMQSAGAYERVLLIDQFVARPSGTNP